MPPGVWGDWQLPWDCGLEGTLGHCSCWATACLWGPREQLSPDCGLVVSGGWIWGSEWEGDCLKPSGTWLGEAPGWSAPLSPWCIRGVKGALNKPSPDSSIPAGEPVDSSCLPTAEERGEGALISVLYCPVLAGDEANADGDGDEPYSGLPIPCWVLKGSP